MYMHLTSYRLDTTDDATFYRTFSFKAFKSQYIHYPEFMFICGIRIEITVLRFKLELDFTVENIRVPR